MYNKKALLILLAAGIIAVQGFVFLSKPKITLSKNCLFEDVLHKEQAVMKHDEATLNNIAKVAVKQKVVSLDLELLGTAIGNVKDPIAFIKDLATEKQGIYRLGSKIKDGKVIKITMGEVVLDIDGRTETLQLSKRGKAWAKVQEDPAIISMSGDRIVVSKQGLMGQKGKILDSLKTVKIKPYFESKEVVGMKVEGLPEESLISAAGIRNNDIVKTVNNQKIDSYQKALQVFSKVKNQSEIQVCVLRDGQVKNLSYQLGN